MFNSLFKKNICVIDNSYSSAQQIVDCFPEKINAKFMHMPFGQKIFFELETEPDMFIINRDLANSNIYTLVQYIKTKYHKAKIIVYCKENCCDSIKELYNIGIDDYISLDSNFKKHFKLSAEYLCLENQNFANLLQNSIHYFQKLAHDFIV